MTLPQDFGDRLRRAVSHHCWYTRPDHWKPSDVQRHFEACLKDLRLEFAEAKRDRPQTYIEEWMWWLGYFEREVYTPS